MNTSEAVCNSFSAELKELEAMLAEIPKENVLERFGLESRLKMVTRKKKFSNLQNKTTLLQNKRCRIRQV